ncbi:MAG TPA: hypothetical protein VFO79_09095 [Xanthomonadales bacterium]|nr:hypothetical protein [Xanthomonadales bacterium]
MKRVPAAIVVGLVIGVAGSVVSALANFGEPEFQSIARAQLARFAAAVAEFVLVALGLFEIARRASGRVRSASRVAAGLLLVVTAWYLARPLLDVLVDEQKLWVLEVFRWGFFASGLCTLIAVVVLGVVARAPIAVLAAIAVLARGWIPYVTDELHIWLFENRQAAVAYWLVEELLFAVGLLGVSAAVAKQAPPSTSDPQMAVGGFHYVGNGLRIRIVGAIVFAMLAMSQVRGIGLSIVIGGPLVVVVTLAIVAVGCVRVAHADVAQMPRWRLAIGGGLSLWWAVVQYEQIAHVFRDHRVITGASEAFAHAWSIAGPLIATAGLALVGSAISTFAHARTNDELRESASVRTLLYVVLSASAVGIQTQVWKAETRDGFFALTLVAACAAIAALVSFAGLAKQAADAIGAGPTLPPARVTSTKA